MSNGDQSQSSSKSSSSFHFFAGATSGLVSAVVLQPADLLKTRVQQANSISLRSSIRELWLDPNGLRAFWRGTLPSALRTGFGSALYFTSLNALRQNVSRSNLLRSMGIVENGGSHSSALPKLSILANLTTGAIARASAGFVLMPMTVIKVRYESNMYAYKSIVGASKDILRTEGLRGFFSGFGATAVRDAPYAGLYVLFYEQLKKRLSLIAEKAPLPGDEVVKTMTGSTSASINFGSGAVAAGLATAFTNPFDSIKTRIQLQPKEYRNMFQAARKMVAKDGFRSFFDGLGLRMGRKVMSSALAWTLYEELIRRAETTWKATKKGDDLLKHV